jgi:regulation of enolase protein 1 (concanavalin A-like superfamily)/phosphatidylserine/phosphatidylglycerophosphate/cardiolipin synthase-like enzyme
LFALAAIALVILPARSFALDRFCDVAFEDCRAPLIQLIDNETERIDVGFWFMEDGRYSAALARAVQRGVKVRVIFDSEELNGQSDRQFVIDQLISFGIPIREKVDPGITHWKIMIFSAQHTVEFSGANFTSEGFVPETPYSAYEDEVIVFTEDPSLLASFKTKYDDVWTNTSMLANYANVTTIERVYPTTPIDPRLNFPPFDDFRARSVQTYAAENTRIDVVMYRITDRSHSDALIENVKRGVPTRLITEPQQYRDPTRLWHAWNVDRLYIAGQQNLINGQPGIQIRHRQHLGLTHEKLTLMIGQGMTVFGSSNWTSPSTESQLEHNLFTTDPAFFSWAENSFERKWNNLGPSPETTAFVPLPPDVPTLTSPVDGATNQPVSVTLEWHGGEWAHKYDVFLGTDPNHLVKMLDDEELGPYDLATTISGLAAGTRYYWYVVSRTMANLTSTSAVHSFVTAGSVSGNLPPAVSLTRPVAGTFTLPTSLSFAVNASDADGAVARVEYFANSTPVAVSTTAPFTATWNNVPAGTYTLTARATDNAGATTTSAGVTVTLAQGTSNLPGPWAQQDIGGVSQSGGASVANGTFSVWGSGADVWDTSDQFHFVHQPLSGDGTVLARVSSVQAVDGWTKAGVMIRESLTPGSRHAFMFATPGTTNGLAFQRRVNTNDVSTHSGASGAPPVWVKLTRAGTLISAYWSADGVNWTLVGSDTFPMGTTVFAGLAVCAHNSGLLATASFDNVSVTPAGGPPPNVPPSITLTSPTNGATFTAPANITISANASDGDGAVTRVDFFNGATLVQSVTTAPYAITWSNVPSGTYTLSARVTDNAGGVTTSSSATITVNPSQAPGLPAPWTQQDVGAVGQAGGTSLSGGTFTITGSGTDVWDTSDQFHFVYMPLSGDGSVVARVPAVQAVDVWTKAGVMIRESLAPGSRHAFMFTTPGTTKGLAFQRRVTTDDITTHDGADGAPPAWVKLTRAGTTIAAYRSNDGMNWTLVGSDTFAMGTNVLAGLAVTAHNNSALAAATFDNVSVTPAGAQTGLPAGWSNQDIGGVAAAGSTSYTSGVFTLNGSGTDIWGTADEFQFAYRSMTGDGTIVAHVQSVQFVDRWTKAGVMLRASLAAGSRQAMMIVSPGKGSAFQRRTVDNGDSVNTAGPFVAAPAWVKLQRAGSLITASLSTDGANWTVVDTEVIDLPATVLVGLPLTSHLNGAVATATVDNVTVTP